MDSLAQINVVGYDEDGKEFSAMNGFPNQLAAHKWLDSNKHLYPGTTLHVEVSPFGDNPQVSLDLG